MKMDHTADETPLIGPLPGRTQSGDAALFEDETGTLVARMTIMPCFTVPILVLIHPTESKPHPDPRRMMARCTLLGAPEREGYRGWNDPGFLSLCKRFGIDPAKQRPRFDAWFEDVGEALLDCASDAFDAKRYDEHGAAGGAADALKRGATPDSVNLASVIWHARDIRDPALRERTEAALAQLERSADWQDRSKRGKAEALQELIDAATAAGTPVNLVPDTGGPGGVIVFGDVDDVPGYARPSRLRIWMRRVFG